MDRQRGGRSTRFWSRRRPRGVRFWCSVVRCGGCVCVSGTLVCSQLLENGRQAAPSGTFPSLLRAASWSGSQPKHSRPNLDARLLRLGWIFNFASHFLNGCPTQDGQSEGLRSIACFSRPRPPPLHQPARASQPAATQDGSCPSSPSSDQNAEGSSSTLEPLPGPRSMHMHMYMHGTGAARQSKRPPAH